MLNDIYIYIYISLVYTRLYIFIIHVMKIQCQNIMLNKLPSLRVSSVVAILFTKKVFDLFFAVSRTRRRPVSHDL